jgi:hypothetical protein
MTWQRRSNDQPGIAFDARLRVIQPPIFLQAGLKDCLTPLHTTEECRLLFGQLSRCTSFQPSPGISNT